jgi:hypothetical protein
MKSFVAAATLAALLSGVALTSASAAPGQHGLTPWERAQIVRSSHELNALRHRVHADGRVTLWERMRLNVAEARHHALVERYRNN